MSSNSKLTDKASKLDFSNLPPLSPRDSGTPPSGDPTATGLAYKPKTAPGAMMAFAVDARSELVRENERLKGFEEEASSLKRKVSELAGELSQWDGASATRRIDPVCIRRSRWANRHEHSFNDHEFTLLKDEILSAGGNVQPIKVRRIGREGDVDLFEIVFGHRRHQACLDLKLPVLATVENVSDQGLFVEMDRENRSRKNLSPWEQGAMYLRALEEGLFSSQRKLAEAVGVDLSALGKALNLARLPLVIVRAFRSPLDIQFRWAKPLTDALIKDGSGILARAEVLAEIPDKPSAKVVFEHLVNGRDLSSGTVPPPTGSTSIKLGGKTVGVLQMHSDGAVQIQLRAGLLKEPQLAKLSRLMTDFLAQTSQSSD